MYEALEAIIEKDELIELPSGGNSRLSLLWEINLLPFLNFSLFGNSSILLYSFLFQDSVYCRDIIPDSWQTSKLAKSKALFGYVHFKSRDSVFNSTKIEYV